MNAKINLVDYHPYRVTFPKVLTHLAVPENRKEPEYADEEARNHAQRHYDNLLGAIIKRMKRRKITGWSLDRMPFSNWVGGRMSSAFAGLRYDGDSFYSMLFVSPSLTSDHKWIVVTPTIPAGVGVGTLKQIGAQHISEYEFRRYAKLFSNIDSIAKWVADAPRLTNEIVLRALYPDIIDTHKSMATFVSKHVTALAHEFLREQFGLFHHNKDSNKFDSLRFNLFSYLESCMGGVLPNVMPEELMQITRAYVTRRDHILGMRTEQDLNTSMAFVQLGNATYVISVKGPETDRCLRLPKDFPIPVDIKQRIATVQINTDKINSCGYLLSSSQIQGVGAKLTTNQTKSIIGALVFANETDYNAVFA